MPIGLQLSRVAKTVSAAFEAALTSAGGSLPTWLILLNLKLNQSRQPAAAGRSSRHP